MPELPEVESARALIAEHGLGREIVDVDDADTYVCRTVWERGVPLPPLVLAL
jgi:formamidopyrimidine-DNA glycosylase